MSETACPAKTDLVEFSRGTLSAQRADELTSHVEGCSICVAELSLLSSEPDAFISHLRECAASERFAWEPPFRKALKYLLRAGRADDEPSSAAPGKKHEPHVESPREQRDFTGRVLRDYQLLELLGEGGMGRVYRAVHIRLERIVALKTLSLHSARSPQALARFEREMKAIGRLDHPSIVRAHDAGEKDGVVFLVMEYVDGVDLARLCDTYGRLQVAEACELIRQAADAIEQVHQFGMVHRDLKPSNLMATAAGKVKLLDLGLALLHTEMDSHSELTDTGQVMGTVDYMAPEQFGDAHAVDARADVYSLGCTLYRLLAGHAPFAIASDRNAFKKLLAHATRPVPDIRGINSAVSDELWQILQQMLAKTPTERFTSAGEVALALAPHTAGADVASLVTEARSKHRRSGDETINRRANPASTERSKNGFPSRPQDAPFHTATTGKSNSDDIGPPAKHRPKLGRRAIVVGVLLTFAIPLVALLVSGRRGNSSGPAEDDASRIAAAASPPVVGSESIPAPADDIPREPVELSQSGAISRLAHVSHPPALDGVLSWTIELRGNWESLYAVTASPEGSWLATGGVDGMIRVWNPDTTGLIRILVGHDGAIERLAASPDGSLLAASSGDGMLRIWAVRFGAVVRTLHLAKEVDDISWSPNSRTLAFCAAGSVFKWEFVTSDQAAEVYAGQSPVRRLAWRPVDNERLADRLAVNSVAIAAGNKVELLDVQSGRVSRILAQHETEVTALAWTRAGRILATAARSPNAQVSFAMVDSPSQPTSIPLEGTVDSIKALAWSPNMDFLAAACKYDIFHGRVYVWSRTNRNSTVTLDQHANSANSVAWLPDSDRLASVGGDGALFLWSRQLGNYTANISHITPDSIQHAACSPDGGKLALGLEMIPGVVFERPHGKLMGWRLPAANIAWSDDAQFLAMSTGFPYQLVIRDRSGKDQAIPFSERIDSLSWSPVELKLAVGNGPRIVLVDPTNPEQLIPINGLQGVAEHLQWSSDAALIAVKEQNNDRTVKVFDVAERRLCAEHLLADGLTSFAWARQRPVLAVAGRSRVTFIDAIVGQRADGFSDLECPGIERVAWSPSGQQLATISADRSLRIWDVGAGSDQVRRYLPTVGRAVYLSWLANPPSIVTVSRYGLAQFHDPISGTCQGTVLLVTGGDQRVNYIVLGANGHFRANAHGEERLEYVVQTQRGQDTYRPWEFREQFGWNNDPDRLSLASVQK